MLQADVADMFQLDIELSHAGRKKALCGIVIQVDRAGQFQRCPCFLFEVLSAHHQRPGSRLLQMRCGQALA
jgi:hypothetical protein